MTGRDRTLEFQSVVKYALTKNSKLNRSFSKTFPQISNEFFIISKKIAKDIANTNDKLESLQLLIENDYETSYQVSSNELSDIIRQDLSALNKQIAQLQQFLKNKTMLNKQRFAHSTAVIVTLQSKLAQMSAHFKCLLEVKQQKMIHSNSNPHMSSIQHKQDEYYNPTANGVQTLKHDIPAQTLYYSSNNQQQQYPAQQSQQPQLPSWKNSRQTNMYKKYDHYDDQQSQQPLKNFNNWEPQPQHYNNSKQQQQMLRQRFVQEEEPDKMVKIEQTIVELGGIFQQLATMVQEQGEMVCRIDSHTDESQLNVEVAHTELVKYLHNVASTRSFIIKVFIILIFFVIFFLYFYG